MLVRLVPLQEVDEGLLHQWQELAKHCLEPNPSFEPGMTRHAAALPEAPQISLLVVHDHDRLHALAPVTRARRYRHMPIPVLATWVHDYTLLGTPLVLGDDPVGALDAAVGHLMRHRVAPWWVLEGICADGPVADALREALRRHDLRATTFLDHDRGGVLHHGDGTGVGGNISTKGMQSLRRRRRRLSEHLEEEVHTSDAATSHLSAAIEGFLHAEASGWKGRDGGAFLRRPGHADFFRAVCREFAAAGRLQFFTLGTSSTTVAYQCNLVSQQRAFVFKITYDEDYRRYSPGTLLTLDTLADFHAQDELTSIDSCISPQDEGNRRLYPDPVAITTLLIPLTRVRGRAAARGTPAITRTGRLVRQWLRPQKEEKV